MIAALAAAWYNTNSALTAAQLRNSEARRELLMFDQASPLPEMFASVRQTPTPEGLKAISLALLERHTRIRALIELHRHEITKQAWANFTARPPEQTTVFFFNLAHKEKVSDDDWMTYDQIAHVWLQHEGYMQIDTATMTITNPTSFTASYVSLITELSTIVKAP